MKIIVAADEHQKNELAPDAGAEIVWVQQAADFLRYKEADAFIDLKFTSGSERVQVLKSLLPKTVVINSVLNTATETDESFVRINGWPTFLHGEIIEAATIKANKEEAEKVFNLLQKKMEWTPDIVGFITPRILSMIINEAYFAFEEEVSSKEEINLAMRLGTNYPLGPFEWAEKIGLKNIAQLLQKLAAKQSRYQPSPLLMKEAEL